MTETTAKLATSSHTPILKEGGGGGGDVDNPQVLMTETTART